MTRPLPLLPCLLLVAACGPLVKVGDSGPRPDALLTLSALPAQEAPEGAAAPGTPGTLDMAAAIAVETPTVPGALQTLRIPVTVSATEIRYVPVAQWSEPPNRLFRRLLADRLAADGVGVVDVRSVGKAPGRTLSGQLLSFGVDVHAGRVARIRYDATLVDETGVRQRRFEASEPLAAVDGPTVASALNRAANRLAGEVSAWLQPGL